MSVRVTVQPRQDEAELVAKRAAAKQAIAVARDPNAAASLTELRRVVTDIMARLEWLERQVELVMKTR